MDLTKLTTEQSNAHTANLDEMSPLQIVQAMNREDATVPLAIEKELPIIAKVIEVTAVKLSNTGRLLYIGAGTSGRLGVLDAAECPPTFYTDPEMVQGLIAGGEKAMFKAIEGAEDSEQLGQQALQEIHLTKNDVVVGIAASGRTPYVIGALKYALEIGATTVALSCNKNAEISQYAQHAIEVPVGPEVLTGSTRLKAGTAQKLVLNMISTGTMIQLGKAYNNLMIDVQPTNSKLVERAKYILMQITNVSYERAEQLLTMTDYRIKPAMLMEMANVDLETAGKLLENSRNKVKKALTLATGEK